MNVIDLTHTISCDMPVFPGTEQPQITQTHTYEKDGFKESRITMVTHTGTHMDPPIHVLYDHKTVDCLDVDCFVGKGVVIDCHHLSAGEKITFKEILPFKEKADQADFLLFYTGWDKLWGTDEYFGEYPSVADDVIDYLLTSRKKGIGVDVIGLDPVKDSYLTHHRQLFVNDDKIIIENLTNLDKLVGKDFTFISLPLKISEGDGSPVRAIAITT